MSFYVKQLLEDVEEKMSLTIYRSPGTKETFISDDEVQVLQGSGRVYFRSAAAKLLYLAKHMRPDIVTVVTFFCRRVQNATIEDERKLARVRVLGYLKGTADHTLMQCMLGMECNIVACVDAAYALQSNYKSHAGVVIYVGGTLVYVASRKQKCMSKSLTEAELIALMDNLDLMELFQEFVEFVTKKRIKAPGLNAGVNMGNNKE
jgi:hypothetical protein